MQTTPHFLSYANLSTAIVCATADPSGKGRHAVGIYAGVGGTAVVRPRGGAANGSNDRTLTLVAGMPPLDVEFSNVVSGTATAVTIFWARNVS